MIGAKMNNEVMQLNQWINVFFLCILTGKLYICTPCHTYQSEVTTVENTWTSGHMTLVRGLVPCSGSCHQPIKICWREIWASMPPPCSSLTNLHHLQAFCPNPSLSKSSLEKSLEDMSLMKVLENTFALCGLYNWSLTQNLYKWDRKLFYNKTWTFRHLDF